MNFKALEYFVATAREGSISHAAEAMYISQQAMSNHIKKLESEIGVELFERTTPLKLTYAGVEFLKNANHLLAMHKQMLREMSDIRDESKGTLFIGINHSRGASLLPDILPIFHKKNPGIDVRLVEGYSTSLEEAMFNNEVDFNIGFCPRFVEQVKTCVIDVANDSIVMLVSKGLMRELFGKQEEEVCRRMQQKPDIMLFRDAPFVMLNHKMTIRKQVDEFMMRQGFVPHVIMETASLETQLALGMKNFGICFHSQTMIQGLNASYRCDVERNMYAFNFKDPMMNSKLCVYFRRDRYLSYGARAFIEELMRFYKNPQKINWSDLNVLQD